MIKIWGNKHQGWAEYIIMDTHTHMLYKLPRNVSINYQEIKVLDIEEVLLIFSAEKIHSDVWDTPIAHLLIWNCVQELELANN